MYNTNDIIRMIKKSSIDCIENSKPAKYLFGTVVSISPLKINVEQKMIFSEEFFTLTSNVIDYEVEMEFKHFTEDTAGHKHEVKGTKIVKVKNGLKTGEKVILIQNKGGQGFLVIDKIRC